MRPEHPCICACACACVLAYVRMYVPVYVPKYACAPVSRMRINASCDIYRCTKTTGALHVHFFVQFLRSDKRFKRLP